MRRPRLPSATAPCGSAGKSVLNVDSIEDQLNWFKAEGLVDGSVSLETILDTSYVETA